ncbi:phage integrase central domain-containing protein [Novosphingobium sp. B 225]|uniref:phage integrase central domain-containing protein n=1 Tax=Novosphingobium sp. B 225 TaxID=1961849 RepID=UPI000B4B8539|nr:hypothetical protein [Novosphingobium sp. B 225]
MTFKPADFRIHGEQATSWMNSKHQHQRIMTLEQYVFPLSGKRLVNDIEGPLIRNGLSERVEISRPIRPD